MKKVILSSLVAVLLVGLAGCSKFLQNEAELQAEKDETALQTYMKKLPQYTFTKSDSRSYFTLSKANPSGREMKVGDEVTFYYKISLLDSFGNSAAGLDSIPERSGKPAVGVFVGTAAMSPISNLSVMAANLAGMTEAIFRCRDGESIIMLLPSSWGYGETGFDKIPANATLRVDIKIVKLRDEKTRVDEYTDAYVKEKSLKLRQRDADGFNLMVVDEKPTAVEVKTGSPVKVKYTGYLMTGTKFDEGEFSFTPGSSQVVIGFDRAAQKSRIGEKVRVAFPSALGYGNQTRGAITPYSPLIFDIEFVSQ
jgi:FKBP-type peptidyl-prolyl cis-trans isomerase